MPDGIMLRVLSAYVLIMCLILLVLAEWARAHEWYPIECCHGLDCAPVERVEVTRSFSAGVLSSPAFALGPVTMVVTTKHGSVAVPADFPRRQSKDHQMHACMRKAADGSMRLLCLFLPPGS